MIQEVIKIVVLKKTNSNESDSLVNLAVVAQTF